MRFLRSDELPRDPQIVTFRAPRLPMAFGAGTFCCITFACVWLLLQIASALPTAAWILLGPLAVIFFGVLVVLDLSLLGALVSSFQSANWVMKVVDGKVYFNLRHFLNGKRCDTGDTVALLACGEIENARKVTILNANGGASGEMSTSEPFLQLELSTDASEELQQAVRRERSRPAVTSTWLGVTSTTKAPGSPLTIPGPGTARITWAGGGMLRALEALGVERHSKQRIHLDSDQMTKDEATDHLLNLCERGNTVEAIGFARRSLAMSLREAHDLVHGLIDRAA